MITAEEARKLANQLDRKLIGRIEVAIREAANKHEQCVWFCEFIHAKEIEFIESVGFKVEVIEDPREPLSYKISW